MKFTVDNLSPISVGVPTYAPKMWRMTSPESDTSPPRPKRSRLRLFRPRLDLIDQLEPVSSGPTNA